MKKYQKVADAFRGFFDHDELGKIIDRKADLELISRLKDLKADNACVSHLESQFNN